MTTELSRSQTSILIAALVTAVVSFQLNASMLVPAISDINANLGGDAYTQMSSYFFLAGAIISVVCTRWSDYVGRKLVLVSTMAVMCVGTVVCIAATSIPVAVIGRILQGGCVIAFSLSYLILREHLSNKMFGVSVGIISSTNGGVAGVDALLGGVMVDHLGYRSLFWLILVVGVVAIALAIRAVPADPPTARVPGRMDWWGAALLAVAVSGINLYLIAGGTDGWLSPGALTWIAVAAAALVALIIVDSRVSSPLIAVAHMRSRQVWPVITSITLALAAFYVVLNFIIPMAAQDPAGGFAMTATMTAVALLTPAALVGLAAAPLAGRLAVRISFASTLRLGILAALAITVATTALGTHLGALIALMVLFGAAYNGLLLTSASGMGVVQAPDDAPGSLPGISNACFGIGASIGFAWAGPIVNAGNYQLALWICVGIGIAALASSAILVAKPVSAAPAR